MILDLQHNKIVRETVTDKFAESVSEVLVPMLAEKYGDGMLGIQMYEDYISDNFARDGRWYYPMTVITASGPVTEWISWKINKASFKDGVPYSYVGDALLDFELTDAPEDVKEKLSGRAIYCEEGILNVRIDTVVPTPVFLSGKYSQTFIDEMSRQLTVAIASATSVETLVGSSIELALVFAPETYMEHTSENVTYRRLLIVDKSSAPRDFWIKWTRLDGATAYSVCDNVSADNIIFEIGEDVSQKVREKEYRCLIRLGKDKYHNAMGRKNVTEWRELIKRAIRRGELVRVETVEIDDARSDELNIQLAKLLGTTVPASAEPAPLENSASDEFEAALKKLAEQTMAESDDEPEQTSDNFVFAGLDIDAEAAEFEIAEPEEADGVLFIVDEPDADTEDDEEYLDEEMPEEEVLEEEMPEEEMLDEDSTEDEQTLAEVAALEPDFEPDESVSDAPVQSAEDVEAKIRAELEAKIRLEYESRARIKAEEEAERLRKEQEELRAEHEKLQEQMARERREQALKEEEMRAEEARLRAQIEVQLRAEARERERLAEAARAAVEEQRRLEAEHAKMATERAEEQRRALEEQHKRAEEQRRAEEDRLRRAESQAKAQQRHVVEDNKYTYTSKVVRLIFRRSVDPNITQRIHEIIKVTLEYYGKDKIYLKVKASVPDSHTVCLEFMKIPMEEMQLLSNIIKVLGNSGLGIAKAIVE